MTLSRWTRCLVCGAPASVEFVRPYCTDQGCRWYDERVAWEWASTPPSYGESRPRSADPWAQEDAA